MKITIFLFLLLQTFGTLATADPVQIDFKKQRRSVYTTWRCSIIATLRGDGELAFMMGEDTLSGFSKIHCVDLTTGRIWRKNPEVKIVLSSGLDFAFSTSDQFEVYIFTFVRNIPETFFGEYYFEKPHSQVFWGEEIEVSGVTELDYRNFEFNIAVLSELSITPSLNNFLGKATMTLYEVPRVPKTKNNQRWYGNNR